MDQFRLPRRIIGSPLEFSRYDLRISIPRIIVDKRERSSLSFVFPQTFLPFSPLFNKSLQYRPPILNIFANLQVIEQGQVAHNFSLYGIISLSKQFYQKFT